MPCPRGLHIEGAITARNRPTSGASGFPTRTRFAQAEPGRSARRRYFFLLCCAYFFLGALPFVSSSTILPWELPFALTATIST